MIVALGLALAVALGAGWSRRRVRAAEAARARRLAEIDREIAASVDRLLATPAGRAVLARYLGTFGEGGPLCG